MQRIYTIIEVQEVVRTVVWRHRIAASTADDALVAVRSREVPSEPELVEVLGDDVLGRSTQEVINTDEIDGERAALHRAIATFVRTAQSE